MIGTDKHLPIIVKHIFMAAMKIVCLNRGTRLVVAELEGLKIGNYNIGTAKRIHVFI
jgi:hypothetical protein